MAYVFSNIQGQLDEDGKQNIFGAQGSQQQAGTADQQAMGTPVAKTSTEGEIGPGGQGSSDVTQGKAAPDSTRSRQQVIDRSAQRQGTPKAVTQLGSNIDSAKQAVQDEANAYMTDAKGRQYGIAKDNLAKAAEGDQAAFSEAQKRLSQQQAERLQQFAPKAQYDYNAERLQTDAGIKDMFREEVGPQYTRGEGAFDSILLQRNPRFNQLRQDIVGNQIGLRADVANKQENLTKEAQGVVDKRFADDTTQIKGDLGSISQQQVAAAEARAQAEMAERAKMDRAALAAQEEQALVNQLRSELAAGGPRSFDARALKFLDANRFDENKYLNFDDQVTYQEMVNADESRRFNNVMSLLGDKNRLDVGKGPGAAYSFDTGGLKSGMVEDIRTLRGSADQASQAQINALREAAKQDAARMNAEAQSRMQRERDAAVREALEWEAKTNAAGQRAGNARVMLENFDKVASQYDPSKFGGYRQLIEADLYNQDRYGQAANLAADLGIDNPFALGNADQQYKFNSEALRNAIHDMITASLTGGGDDKQSWVKEGRAPTGAEAWGAVRSSIPTFGGGGSGGGGGGFNIPLPSGGGGGGKIICTAYCQLGWLPENILLADLAYQRKYTDPEHIKNYLAWAQYVVPLIKKNRFVRYAMWPVSKTWAYQMAYKMGAVEKKPAFGFLFETVFLGASNLVGRLVRRLEKKASKGEGVVWTQ